MKCDVIKDLLPLYIENLCSEESKQVVEEHLEQCKECRQEYIQLRGDYISHTDNQNAEVFLEEKDLLQKSKQEIKESFANKILKKFYSVILVLGLFMNVIMVIVAFVLYKYKYPRLYFEAFGYAQIWILVLPFLPTILALIGRMLLNKSKKYKIFSRILLVGMIPSIVLGGFYTLFFLITPPISSTTKNPANYMKVDGDIEPFEESILNFYPAQIPDSAKQANYFYQRYSTFFTEEINVEASWILPQTEYNTVKQQVLGLNYFKESNLSESGGNGTIISTILPENVTIVFDYNDDIKRVAYHAYTTKNY